MQQRQTPGWALISERSEFVLRAKTELSAVRHVAIQEDPANPLPSVRAPLLLDTVTMAPARLVLLLLALRKAKIATVAIVSPADFLAQRLVPLCPAVRVLVSDEAELDLLSPFARYLARLRFDHPAALIGLSRPDLQPALPPLLLDVLHSLPNVKTHDETALSTGLSRASLFRLLAEARAALGVADDAKNLTPSTLQQRLYAALAQPNVASLPLVDSEESVRSQAARALIEQILERPNAQEKSRRSERPQDESIGLTQKTLFDAF
jgi:hypothetical protein